VHTTGAHGPQYSLFANASTRGTPPVRPLFFEFPNESELFNVDEQFLIGRDILVTPVLQPNVSTVDGYFPGHGRAQWRDWWTHALVNASNEKVTLDAPLGHINVHIRDGSALLLFAKPGYTIKETSSGPYELLVHLANDGYAHGAAYIDDGESSPPGPATELKFSASKGQLKIDASGKYKVASKLEKLTVLGVGAKPSTIKVGGKSVPFTYDAEVQRVVVENLSKDATVTWS
jgi:alpha-glucosidase